VFVPTKTLSSSGYAPSFDWEKDFVLFRRVTRMVGHLGIRLHYNPQKSMQAAAGERPRTISQLRFAVGNPVRQMKASIRKRFKSRMLSSWHTG
jgi:hypothetical protein